MKNFLKLVGFLTLIAIVSFGCKKKPEPVPVPTVEDGYYVVGTSIFTDSLKATALMDDGYVDPNSTPVVRAGLYVKYMYITKAGEGFKVMQQYGDTTFTYGLDGAFTKTGDSLWDGSIKKDGAAFTVPEDGFYFFMFDDSTMKAHMFKVEEWDFIGGMSGWSDMAMTQKTATKEQASWEIENVSIKVNDEFKFRFNKSWKYQMIAGSYPVHTNFGGALTHLTPGGANIKNTIGGIYTVTLNWSFTNGFSATTVKTADIPITDWTSTKVEIVGAAVDSTNNTGVIKDDVWHWGWYLYSGTSQDGFPTKVENVYTWTWTNVAMYANQFKFRNHGTTNTFDAGFSAVDVAHSSTHVADGGGNIAINTAGYYDMILVIDAGNGDTKTITITDHVKK